MGAVKRRRPGDRRALERGLLTRPTGHDFYDTGETFKDHVGMTYEVWQCRRCACVAKHYPGSHWTMFAPRCSPGKYGKKGKVKRRNRGRKE